MDTSAHWSATLRSRIFIILGTLTWIAALLFLLVVNYFNFATVYFTLYKDGPSLRVAESLLVNLCHRMPSRSFWIYEVPLGLCSRCTGLYFFAFLAVMIHPFIDVLPKKNAFRYSILALFPLCIDSILQHFSVYVGNNVPRFLTGALFGYGIIALVIIFYNHLNHQLNIGGKNAFIP
jgi:uncharacterized membrane protein